MATTTPLLPPRVLCQKTPSDLATYFRSLLNAPSADTNISLCHDINSQLLSLVRTGALPAEVFKLWFSLAQRHCPHLIRDALADCQSRGVQEAGLLALRRALGRRRWRTQGWDAVGGVDGLSELFRTLSAQVAKDLASVIGSRLRSKGPDAQQRVDELVRALLYVDGASVHGHTDTPAAMKRRPMLSLILWLFQACSSSFLAQLFSQPLATSGLYPRIAKMIKRFHPDLLRKIIVGSIKIDDQPQKYLLDKLSQELLSTRVPFDPQFISHSQLPPSLTPGLVFCFDILAAVGSSAVEKGKLSDAVLRDYIAVNATQEAVRNKVPFASVLRLLRLALETVPRRNTDCLETPQDSLACKLISYWAIAVHPDVDLDHKIGPGLRKRILSDPSRPTAEHRDELEELVIRCVNPPEKNQFIVFSIIKPWVQSQRGRGQPRLRFGRKYGGHIHSRGSGEYGVKFDSVDIEAIPASARLPLLKLLCPDLQRIYLDAAVFATLPTGDSKWLFQRLNELGLRDRINFSILGELEKRSSRYSYPTWYLNGLFHIKWESDDPASGDYAETRKLLDEAKKTAQNSRNPEYRLNWVMRTEDIAYLSRSIPLLKDVAVWARRFIRDPHVGPRFMTDGGCGAETLACVSFPVNRRPKSLTILSDLVQEAHSLLQFHLETGILALREPGLSTDLQDPFDLLLTVVDSRITGFRGLYRLGLGTDDELAAALFDPLLPIVLEYERKVIEEGHEGIEQDRCWCQNPSSAFEPCSSSPYAIGFLDRLARGRVELWTEERTKREPSVASLGQSWPKGLPIQYLLPSESWAAMAAANPTHAPYFASRLRDVVFCDPTIAVETVPSDTEAIGGFVDSLPFAIHFYIVHSSPIDKQAERLLEVWDHYTRFMPSNAGHVEELREFLRSLADDYQIKNISKLDRAPLLPSLLPDPGTEPGPVEWDPWDGDDEHADTTADYSTVLRSRFLMPDEHLDWAPSLIDETFPDLEPWKVLRKRNKCEIWCPNVDVRTLPLPARESLIVSAILYLDAFAGGTGRLSEPFPPGSSQPRYPAVYLGYDFLSGVGDIPQPDYGTVAPRRTHFKARRGRRGPSDVAIHVLRKLKSTIPPAIIQGLASSLLQALNRLPSTSPKYPAMTRVTFETIDLLSRSDQPKLVIDLGLKAVEDMPDASSWHRHIMSGRLVKELDFEDSENMLKAFWGFVLRDLRKPTPPSVDGDSEPKHVKVTTLKILPQVIDASPSISFSTSLDILRSLFSASGHVDVRYQVLRSLLGLFEKFGELNSQAVTAKVFDALASLALAATVPSERAFVSEEQWQEAEDGGKLPEVHADRPLEQLFLKGVSTSMPLETREAYVHQVVLKILDESTKQHNRWMKILLSRIQLSPDEASITDFGPFGQYSVDSVLENCISYLPKSFLLRHRGWAMAYGNNRALQRMNEKLMARNPEWPDTDPARQHWTAYLDRHTKVDPLRSLRPLLQSGVDSKVKDAITFEAIQEEYFERTQMLVRELPNHDGCKPPRPLLQPFETSFAHLASLAQGTPKKREKYGPLLERIVSDVESLRTRSWLDNPSRTPKLLPSRLRIRAAMLPFPHLQPGLSGRYDNFADRLGELVQECALSPSCMADFEHLNKEVQSIEQKDKLRCAVAIGNCAAGKYETLAGCLNVQLAWKLLQRVKTVDSEETEDVRALLTSWEESPVEGVRLTGWQAENLTPLAKAFS